MSARNNVGRRGWLAAGAALLAAGCAPAALLNRASPDIPREKGLAYGPLPRHRLDLYRPLAPRPGAPLVVFFYGGNWTDGERAMYRFVAASLAEAGCFVAIPDYRLFPGVRFPAFLEDSALATGWACDRRAQLGAGGVWLLGHSAGAYNVAMLALQPRWLQAVGRNPRRDLAGAIGLAGPYDFLPLRDEELEAIFAPDPAVGQPINHVAGDNPPMLLLQGLADETVRPRNAESLAARIAAAGGPVEMRLYPQIGHAAILGALAGPLRFLAPVRRDVLAFMGLGSGGLGAPPAEG
ncbi:alpha/beta hydrolase [Roseomonas sp. 18066]|uniref:alpha/beta hydrolase n=1 Tax=Roseomonas sp. 18066 TaxID=2681412 RepID=UPI00190F9556|nr:alpha/beta hydrolase [Roseomonas sp. 18066]